MKYIHYDKNTGEILGYYDSKIHKKIPSPNLKVALDEWRECINKQSFYIDLNTLSFVTKENKLSYDEKQNYARQYRDNIRNQVDKLYTPTYTISDELLTSSQRIQLEDYCLELARWPKQRGWPNIEFPIPPEWLEPILDFSEWSPN